MTFRFRRSLKLGGVKLNVTKNGISSISLGGRGASLNIPVARSGGIRGTVGIPGSGLSYSHEYKKSTSTAVQPKAVQMTSAVPNNIPDKSGPLVAVCFGFVGLAFAFLLVIASNPSSEVLQPNPVNTDDMDVPNGIPGDCSGNRWMSPGCTSGTGAK